MAFQYRNHELWCDEVPLQKIIDEVGTPFYVYNAKIIRRQVRRIQKAFAAFNPTIHYSLKANANLTIIRLLAELGLGMDAVSGGEIFRAIKAEVNPSDIVFAGVGKTPNEIRYALEVGVGWFNVESVQELALLNALAWENQQQALVALRLNPDIQASTHHYIATGHGSTKFGMTAETITQILAHQSHYPNLTIAGLHLHIGSQLEDVEKTVEAVHLAQMLAEPHPTIRTLNLGGGFPVSYTPDKPYPWPKHFAQALTPLLTNWSVKLEPGRFIIAEAGALIVTLLYTKTQGGKHFAIVDGSMAELIRPALYNAVHPVVPLRQTDTPFQPTVVVGPVCESADVLHHNAELPPLASLDRLAVLMTGAYGFTMASNYNQRPRPPEVLVDGEEWKVIRHRETWDDLIRGE